jgi:hypothetical protein
MGAVSGKFVAREFPHFQEWWRDGSTLKHDAPVVSVRRTRVPVFTIYPGNGEDARFLDGEHTLLTSYRRNGCCPFH